MINVFSFFLENTNNIDKVFNYNEDNNSVNFNFYYQGRLKNIHFRFDKKKRFNFFEYLHKAYCKLYNIKYLGSEYVTNKVFELTDIFYDLIGSSVYEYDLKNKNVIDRTNYELKSLVNKENTIVYLINDDDFNSLQYCYQILSTYELDEEIKLCEYTTIKNTLFKVRIFHDHDNLKTDYSQRYLLDSGHNFYLAKELYMNNKDYTSWMCKRNNI